MDTLIEGVVVLLKSYKYNYDLHTISISNSFTLAELYAERLTLRNGYDDQ